MTSLKKFTLTSGLYLLLCLCFGIIVIFTNGLDGRVKKFNLKGFKTNKEYFNHLQDNYFLCENRKLNTNEGLYPQCFQSKRGSVKNIIFGDSHSNHLFIGLANHLHDKGVLSYYKNSIPDINNSDFFPMIEYLQKHKAKLRVFITFNFLLRKPSQINLSEGLTNLIRKIKSMKHEVVIIGGLPDFRIYTVDNCLKNLHALNLDNNCTLELSDFLDEYKPYSSSLGIIAKNENTAFVEIYEALCDKLTCRMIRDDKLLFRDDVHLNEIGSLEVSKIIMKKL